MAYCSQCGYQMEPNASFCPHCGANQCPKPAVKEKKVDGGIRGKSIASVVLGGEGLPLSIFAMLFALLQFVAASSRSRDAMALVALCFLYTFLFGLISLGSGIAGVILGGNALKVIEDYRLAKIGKTLSMIALIISAVALFFGFVALGSIS